MVSSWQGHEKVGWLGFHSIFSMQIAAISCLQ